MNLSRILIPAVLLGAAGVLLPMCLSPADGCVPTTTRCNGQQAEVCDGATRWTVTQDCTQIAAQSGGSWSCCALRCRRHGGRGRGAGPHLRALEPVRRRCVVTTPGQAPTAADVTGLWTYMTAHYGSSVINKSSSAEMQLVSTLLDELGIVDKAELPGQLHHHHRHAHLRPVRSGGAVRRLGPVVRRSSSARTSTNTSSRSSELGLADVRRPLHRQPLDPRRLRGRGVPHRRSSSGGGTRARCPIPGRSRSCSRATA